MAGVREEGAEPVVPGMIAQAALIARLRARMLRNTLRTGHAVMDLLVRLGLGVILALFGISLGIGLGAMAFVFVEEQGQLNRVSWLLWGVFLAWQFLPLLFAMAGAEFDTSTLLRFPLRFSTFFALSLTAGVLDPVALAMMFWLACIGTGVTLALPGALLWVVALMLFLGGVALLLNRVVYSWLERLLETRRGREGFFLAILLSAFFAQLLGVAGERWGKEAVGWMAALKPAIAAILAALPPGATGLGLEAAARGEAANAAGALLLVAAYGAGLAVLLRQRLQLLYRGEYTGEGRAPERLQAAARVTGWELPGIPATASIVFEKEVRYLFRNTPMLLISLVPVFITGVIGIAFGIPGEMPKFLLRAPEMAYPTAAGYVLLVVAPMVYNSFAYDGAGVQALLLAPVRFRDVLIGKNLMHGALLLGELLAVWVVVAALIVVPGADITAATITGVVFATLLHMSLGNLLSLYFPRRFDFRKFRQHQSGISVLLMFVAMVVISAVVGVVLVGTWWLGGLWWATPFFVAFSAAAWQVYLLTLDHCTRLALERREILTTELCKA